MISSISHYNGKYSKNIERLDSANEKVEKTMPKDCDF